MSDQLEYYMNKCKELTKEIYDLQKDKRGLYQELKSYREELDVVKLRGMKYKSTQLKAQANSVKRIVKEQDKLDHPDSY